MLRTYVFFLLIAAFVASLLSGGADPAPEKESPDDQRMIAVSAMEERPEGGSQEPSAFDAVELRRSRDGHFYADVIINGAQVNVLVDTGATGIALTREDARRVGLPISARMDAVIGRGPSGDVHGEHVRLDRIALGNKSAERVPAVVLDMGHQSLLGQSFLQQFDSVEIKGDKMLLR